MVLNQHVCKRSGLFQIQARMKRDQAFPDGEGGGKLPVDSKFADYAQVAIRVGRQDIVENSIDVGIDAPASRKRFGAALWVDVNCPANLRESLRDLALTKEKIP